MASFSVLILHTNLQIYPSRGSRGTESDIHPSWNYYGSLHMDILRENRGRESKRRLGRRILEEGKKRKAAGMGFKGMINLTVDLTHR